MAVGMSSWMMMMFGLLLGGGTDLLDYLPTKDYWQAQGVVVVAHDALVKELAPAKPAGDLSGLIGDLGSANPERRDAAAAKIVAAGPGAIPQLKEAAGSDVPEVAGRAKHLVEQIRGSGKANAVRRLMAIRTLGEMKDKAALPALKQLAGSDEPFVADYAQAATAAIEGRPYARPHPSSADDAWLMPEPTRAVLHLQFAGGGAIDFDALMKQVEPLAAMGGPDAPKPDDLRKQVVAQLLAVVEKTGNIRLDGLTVGVAGAVGQHEGFVAAIVHGQYDPAAVAELVNGIPEAGKDQEVVGGTTVFHPAPTAAFFFPNGTLGVITGGPDQQHLPVQDLVTAAKSGAGGIKTAEPIAKLIRGVDTKQAVWGAAQITDTYRQVPFLAAFDTVTLVGQAAGGKTTMRFDAKGSDGAQTANAVAQINDGITTAREDLKRLQGNVPLPGMKPFLDAAATTLESIQCTAAGRDASLTMAVPGGGTGAALLLAVPMGVQRSAPPAHAP